ncbi:LPS-assembly protein LptD [Ramlibacter sp. USB13]|uniref:LPS-assembly protein LptD n=1 Tax=Ramlibacter cellulosilyticus TaxID=2764187 RepID=A0A923SAE6_9BURK|nr:LPS-assembly protein LptD [Ramlibacter cellulosilyticus]MBC5782710.1 LPS-assembly protein LptD [Ramlibacter cellulosilyticus]
MHHPRNKASLARFALSPIALVAASLLQPAGVFAQAAAETSPRLQPSPALRDTTTPQDGAQLPTFVEGDRIQGRPDLETVVEGNAELRRGDTVIRARRLEYNQATDKARAEGDVYINKAGNTFEGPLLELEVDAFHGFFNQPRYRFLQNDAYGEADRVDFIDADRAVIRNASYTTCQRHPGPSWMPDWILRAASISLDQEEEVGHAEGAVLRFKGVPILPVPAISFPLSDKRKSGVLPPTIGLDNRSGLELTLPYYWNIAPNRDATLYPTIMTRRGIDLAGEFRYLEPSYSGMARGHYLPGDRLRDHEDRWGFTAQHNQGLNLPVLGTSALNLNLNRVSDDNYWRDFSRSSASLTQRLLVNEGTLAWGWAGINFNGRVQKWQTLQDPDAPIVPPYDRAPQLTGRWSRTDVWGGLDTYVEGDYTHFTHSIDALVRNAFPTTPEVNQPDGQRSYLVAQVSRPWQAPGWFVIPKAQVHSRYYAFDAPLATGQNTAAVTVPTFSLDSGLVLERETNLFGRGFVQTLEPRAFYVYTPFRDQNRLPTYDSAQVDFNFATIYTENQYGGHDRIADNNLLTLGVNTRFLDPATGAEAAKFGIAQRIRFSDQDVVLPGQQPVSERLSDVLFGASVSFLPKWSADGLLQYNYKSSQSIRSTFGVRYNPGNYRVISAAYRRQQGLSEQIDVGWQWPLNDLWGDKGQNLGPGAGEGEGRWYSVGRLNYSLKDSRLVDGIIGLEYDGGCWIGRVVLERMQAGSDVNKRVLFQLEFVGFSKLGSNALQTLKQNIPRYQFLRERVTTPSRFSNYD